MKAVERPETAAAVGACPRARPSMKERQWILREEAILDAATELLKTKGFNAMTLDDITESIGVSRGTLYQHFKSKEDVATKVVLRNLCTVCNILGTLDPTASPGDKVRTFIRRIVEMRFDSRLIAMFDMHRIRLSQATEDPELQRRDREVAVALAKLIREAQQDGSIWTGITPEMFVLVLTSFLKNYEIDVMVAEGKTTPAEVEHVLVEILFGRA